MNCHKMINFAVFIFYLLSCARSDHMFPTLVFLMSPFKCFQFGYEITYQSRKGCGCRNKPELI